ncbi:hypothetical protein ISCGN_008057 [Ixodes scapularis]
MLSATRSSRSKSATGHSMTPSSNCQAFSGGSSLKADLFGTGRQVRRSNRGETSTLGDVARQRRRWFRDGQRFAHLPDHHGHRNRSGAPCHQPVRVSEGLFRRPGGESLLGFSFYRLFRGRPGSRGASRVNTSRSRYMEPRPCPRGTPQSTPGAPPLDPLAHGPQGKTPEDDAQSGFAGSREKSPGWGRAKRTSRPAVRAIYGCDQARTVSFFLKSKVCRLIVEKSGFWMRAGTHKRCHPRTLRIDGL